VGLIGDQLTAWAQAWAFFNSGKQCKGFTFALLVLPAPIPGSRLRVVHPSFPGTKTA